MKELIFWLTFDFGFIIFETINLMNAIHTHHTGDAAFSAVLWLVWVVLAWRDLDRWTGPKRSVKQRNSDVSQG